jgi:hypothetical protein
VAVSAATCYTQCCSLLPHVEYRYTHPHTAQNIQTTSPQHQAAGRRTLHGRGAHMPRKSIVQRMTWAQFVSSSRLQNLCMSLSCRLRVRSSRASAVAFSANCCRRLPSLWSRWARMWRQKSSLPLLKISGMRYLDYQGIATVGGDQVMPQSSTILKLQVLPQLAFLWVCYAVPMRRPVLHCPHNYCTPHAVMHLGGTKPLSPTGCCIAWLKHCQRTSVAKIGATTHGSATHYYSSAGRHYRCTGDY